MISFFSEYLMPISIGQMMLYIGLGLQFRDFGNLFNQPKSILVGLGSQLLALPALAFAIAWVAPVAPAYKLGLIIIAACPGGTTSNLLTYFMKGRLPLSITLTTFNSFLIAFSIPAFISLGSRLFIEQEHAITMTFWDTLGSVLLTVLLPVLVGMVIRHFWVLQVVRLRKWFRWFSIGFIAVVFAVVIFFGDSSPFDGGDMIAIFSVAFALNFLSTFMGIAVSRLAGLRYDGQFTVGIEVGLQNSALAIYVASQLLGSNEVSLVPVAYGSFSFFTTALWIFLHQKSRK